MVTMLDFGSVLLPVTVGKQLSLHYVYIVNMFQGRP